VLEALQLPLVVNDHELHPSASIGIAIGDRRYHTTDEILRDADIALYRAKSAGTPSVRAVRRIVAAHAMDVLGIEHELRAALSAEQFEPYFQPLLRLADAKIVGYEALVRWNHPQRGVPAAGRIPPRGRGQRPDRSHRLADVPHGLHRRAGTCPRWRFLSPSTSRRAISRTKTWTSACWKSRPEPDSILASCASKSPKARCWAIPPPVAKVLQRLREACIEAALDDFGTGYSSLGYVHRFPLKMIKIDQSFVMPLGHEDAPRSLAVIGAILALARSLGLEVVAEGIETEQQLRILRDMGCVYGQGFLFGRPQPAAYWRARQAAARRRNVVGRLSIHRRQRLPAASGDAFLEAGPRPVLPYAWVFPARARPCADLRLPSHCCPPRS
jgi:EAL domain-containing protein (putative c-di-GMP-specific phosphodiesterase class I)